MYKVPNSKHLNRDITTFEPVLFTVINVKNTTFDITFDKEKEPEYQVMFTLDMKPLEIASIIVVEK